MKTMTSVEAEAHFGQFIDTAQREPVIVTKQHRPVGVFLSIRDIEDTVWGERAQKAHEEEYLSVDESFCLLNQLADARVADETSIKLRSLKGA